MLAEDYVARLLEITNKKYVLLKDMLILTRYQQETITEDGMEQLKEFIEKKQKKIDKINKLDEEFEEYFLRLKSDLGVKRLDEIEVSRIKNADELKQAVKKVLELVGEISQIEKENSKKAKQLLDELGNKVNRIANGRKINAAYNPAPVQVPSYFMDKKK